MKEMISLRSAPGPADRPAAARPGTRPRRPAARGTRRARATSHRSLPASRPRSYSSARPSSAVGAGASRRALEPFDRLRDVSLLLVHPREHGARLEPLTRRSRRGLQRGGRFVQHAHLEVRPRELHVLRRLIGSALARRLLADALEDLVEILLGGGRRRRRRRRRAPAARRARSSDRFRPSRRGLDFAGGAGRRRNRRGGAALACALATGSGSGSGSAGAAAGGGGAAAVRRAPGPRNGRSP